MATNVQPDLQILVDQIHRLLQSGDMQSVRRLLKEEHAADIADIIERLDEEESLAVFNLLSMDVAAEVLDETNTETTIELVDAVSDDTIADLLEAMPVDDAVEILSEIADKRADEIIDLMEPGEAAEVEVQLAYPEHTAGRLMNPQVARLRSEWSVQTTLDYLRTIDPETEILAYLYVADEEDCLKGVVPLRSLVTHPPDTRVRNIMNPGVIAVRVDADQEEVARVVRQYDFSAIPVIDLDGKLIGIITHDDVMDIMQEEFTEDIQRIGGSEPLEAEYLATPIFSVFRKRVGWLLVLFVTEMLTGTVMRHYENELQAVVALSFFVPLLIGTGGNSGSQTTSTIIRSIAMGEVQFKDALRLLWHEMRTGFMLAVVMGCVGFIRAMFWGTTTPLALTVAFSLFSIVLWANVIGAVLPTLAAKLHIDPAVISGPVMSTLVDATGLVIYFTLAHIIIGI